MIGVANLTKSYGTQILFDDVSFTMGAGERAGLVGRNGSGKTTLFRLLLGEEEPDSGTISVPRGFSVGHLSQYLDFRHPTVLGEACRGLQQSEDGTDLTYRVKAVLQGLGFPQDSLLRHPSELSSGFQIRLNLAKLLASEPDILLLDEPTNYLDILSIRWLRGFLAAWPKELLLITHDRAFMDSVTTHTMGIYRRKIRKVRGSTHKLYQQILDDEEVYERGRIHEERKRKELEQFINRFRAQATRARAVQSRIKALERQGTRKRLTDDKVLDFQFRHAPFSGRWPVEVRNLEFRYEGGNALIEGLSLAVGRKDRIGVVGKNGKGKTTLLRLLAGELLPVGGHIQVNEQVRLGFFGDSGIASLDPEKTVEEEIGSSLAAGGPKDVRGICGTMLFEGDRALKKIGVLSGGEKSRVLLGKLMAGKANLLLLDEPTNHLDMESVDALVEALEAFEGAVVIATHSELVLRAVADRLVIFDGASVSAFDGGYDDFLRRIGWREEGPAADGTARGDEEDGRRWDRKEARRIKAEFVNRRSKILGPLQEAIDRIEGRIVFLEERLAEDERRLLKAVEAGDGRDIVSLSIAIHGGREEIEGLFHELDERTREYQGRAEEFVRELNDIETRAGQA